MLQFFRQQKDLQMLLSFFNHSLLYQLDNHQDNVLRWRVDVLNKENPDGEEYLNDRESYLMRRMNGIPTVGMGKQGICGYKYLEVKDLRIIHQDFHLDEEGVPDKHPDNPFIQKFHKIQVPNNIPCSFIKYGCIYYDYVIKYLIVFFPADIKQDFLVIGKINMSETLATLEKHPYFPRVALQLRPEDPRDLIVHPEAALPFDIDSSFDRVFITLEQRAKLVESREHLKQIARPFVTTKTKGDVVVYNNERYPARIKDDTRHTTPLRDVEITYNDLDNMKAALVNLSPETPIYKMYVKAGTGSEKHWFEMYFTPEGAKLAQVAEIMMSASFQKPEGAKIEGRYFAMPEYQEVTRNENPMELIYMNSEGRANIFVGGTTYPGEIYKPICKAMNAWVYLHGGAEIHAAGVLVEYDNPKTRSRKRKLAIISGLSLHGKTTLSMADLSDVQKELLAEKLGVSVAGLNLQVRLLHDDYLFLKVREDGQVEIGCYAPRGIFPAMFGEDPEGLIAKNTRTILFNTVIDPDGRPNFKEPFPFITREGKVEPTKNLRAAAPIETLGRETVEKGVISNPTDVIFITLTRDPTAPSAIKWKADDDALTYFAGLVVAPTDAVVEKAADFYPNFGCTNFDVAERSRLLRRLADLFQYMREIGINVSCYTLNTGPPEKEESLAVRDAIITGYGGKWENCHSLRIDFISAALGAPTLYIPWQIKGQTMETIVEKWQIMWAKREEHFGKIRFSLKKADLTPTALV